MKVRLFHRGEPIEVTVDGDPAERTIGIRGVRHEVAAIAVGPVGGALLVDGRPVRFLAERTSGRIAVAVGGESFEFDLTGESKARRGSSAKGNPETRSPMPGKVLRVSVAVGAAVKPGEPLLILEAMKMENTLAAEVEGVVAEVHVSPGDMVDPGKLLVLIKPTG